MLESRLDAIEEGAERGKITTSRVSTEATFENLGDIWSVAEGKRGFDQIRRLDLADVIVDTDATLFSLPGSMIRQLGLLRLGSRRFASDIGVVESGLYAPVRLTIQGRACTLDAIEMPDEMPPVIGRIALTLLDLVVDTGSGKLIVNPAHDGVQTYELY